MATRWTSRVNPLSWIFRRGPRTAPVAPGGQAEYSTPSAYVKTTQDDYSAADRPTHSVTAEWFGEGADDSGFSDDIDPTVSTYVSRGRPRTHRAEYNSDSQTLRVTFRDGTYDYEDVTPDMWESLKRERVSTGKWLARNGLAGPGSGTRVY